MSKPTQPRNAHGPNAKFAGLSTHEKPKNLKQTWLALIKYCKRYLPAIIFGLLSTAGGSIFQIIGPDKLKLLTNEISAGLSGAINMEAVQTIVFMLICIYALALILNYASNFSMATVTQKISQKMRQDISEKMNRLPLSYFDQTSYGDILSRMTNDVDTIGQTMNQSIATLVSALAMFLGTLIMMLLTNWILALTAIAASIIGFVLMIQMMSHSQKYFAAQQMGLGEINGHIEEAYSNHNVIKVYNGGENSKAIFEVINYNLFTSAWKSQFLSGLMTPLMSFIGNLGYVAVCVVGAVLAMNGTISFGVVVAFMMYIRLFTQPLSQFAQAFNNLQRTAAASERVFEFLNESEMEDEHSKTLALQDVKGDVVFDHVRFGYTPDKMIIHDFFAQIKAGQKVAIVGPTGAGKTTMVNLLMRFYELNSGQILLDGLPIDQVTRENVHDQFCMVLQDTWLFEATIKENIVYNKPNVRDQDIIDVCKTVGLHHFIKTLPEGYDTVLNDTVNLSEGEKQLVTIARAMIRNAPLLILDEATSSVDTRTELIVQNAMDKLMHGRTSFVIAHRLSTIKNADIILVMKDGDIIESGNHNDLMTKGGFYAELYNSQFESVA